MSDLAPDDVRRGMVLASPGYLAPVRFLNAHFRALPELGRPVKPRTAVRVHIGTADVPGHLVLPELAGRLDGLAVRVPTPNVSLVDLCFQADPLAAVAALFLAFDGAVWAPLILLALFNLPHLAFRCGGWAIGYRQGLRSVETLRRMRLPDVAIWIKEGTVILLGVLCAQLAVHGCEHQELSPLMGMILLPVVLLFAWLSRRGVSSFSLVVTTSASLLVLAVLF